MLNEIQINYPGDGEWIMARAGGTFHADTDHTVATHRGGTIVGGVVFTWYIGSAITVHMAGNETNWGTRDFLWTVFHYAFVQLGCRKVLGFVPGYNIHALSVDHRLGFEVATQVPDVFADGSPLIIFSMTKDQCKWLKHVPKRVRYNQELAQ